MQASSPTALNRRQFVVAQAAVAAALVLGLDSANGQVRSAGIGAAGGAPETGFNAFLRIGSDGSIVLRSTAGSITLIGDDNNDAVIAHGAGNVLLQTLGANTDIVVKADIVSTSGNISLLAARHVTFEVLAPFAGTAQTGV